jgi:5-methylcytosine-specific restriction endonuclease McrA
MARHPGRTGVAWRRVCERVLKGATVCHICGGDLDFDAPPRSRWSPSVDHILPLRAMRGLDMESQRRMALDPANLRPAHYGCNSGRGARVSKGPRRTSRAW